MARPLSIATFFVLGSLALACGQTRVELAPPEPAPACESEQKLVSQEVERRKAACEAEVASYRACVATLPELESEELLGCGIGIAAGLAGGGAAEPWRMQRCGVVDSARTQTSCSRPSCDLTEEAIEAKLLAETGERRQPAC